jgi:hypothetical protein
MLDPRLHAKTGCDLVSLCTALNLVKFVDSIPFRPVDVRAVDDEPKTSGDLWQAVKASTTRLEVACRKVRLT